MKKIKIHSLALFVFLAAGLVSCSDDDSNAQAPVLKTAFVNEVTGPETGTVNTELTYNVKFKVDNACGAFDNIAETTQGTTKTLEVKAKYSGSDCGTTPVEKTATYKFKPAAAGAYSLKFKKSATEFVTKTVTVN